AGQEPAGSGSAACESNIREADLLDPAPADLQHEAAGSSRAEVPGVQSDLERSSQLQPPRDAGELRARMHALERVAGIGGQDQYRAAADARAVGAGEGPEKGGRWIADADPIRNGAEEVHRSAVAGGDTVEQEPRLRPGHAESHRPKRRPGDEVGRAATCGARPERDRYRR